MGYNIHNIIYIIYIIYNTAIGGNTAPQGVPRHPPRVPRHPLTPLPRRIPNIFHICNNIFHDFHICNNIFHIFHFHIISHIFTLFGPPPGCPGTSPPPKAPREDPAPRGDLRTGRNRHPAQQGPGTQEEPETREDPASRGDLRTTFFTYVTAPGNPAPRGPGGGLSPAEHPAQGGPGTQGGPETREDPAARGTQHICNNIFQFSHM